MSTSPRKTVGILGGKGPEATVELFRLIVANTPVEKEEDHLRVLIDNHPQIPKCALGITGEGPDSLPALLESARILEHAGADFIVIPCNSAHFYLQPLQAAVNLPFLSMIDATVETVQHAGYDCAALLATSGLVQSGIYQAGFKQAGIRVVVPDPAAQQELMQGILRFKDLNDRQPLQDCLEQIGARLLGEGGAQALVLGCTELPIVIRRDRFAAPLFDTLEILAKAAVRFALGLESSGPSHETTPAGLSGP